MSCTPFSFIDGQVERVIHANTHTYTHTGTGWYPPPTVLSSPVATSYEVERPFEICRWPKEASRTAWLTSNPRFLSLNRKLRERRRLSNDSTTHGRPRSVFNRAADCTRRPPSPSPWPRNRFTMKILKYKYGRDPASGLEHDRPNSATRANVATIATNVIPWPIVVDRGQRRKRRRTRQVSRTPAAVFAFAFHSGSGNNRPGEFYMARSLVIHGASSTDSPNVW